MVGAVLWLAAPVAAAGPRRPPVDLQAMREAMSSASAPPEGASLYPSAATYAHFLRARLAHHDGEHRQALDELRLALASDDGNPYLMTAMAEQWARLSDLPRAEQQLTRVLDASPGYAPAQLLMGRVLYEADRPTRARVHLQKAIRLKPQDADAYLVLAQLDLDQGRLDDAVKVVEDLGRAVPGEPIGFRRLGQALLERGDLARAERLLTRAVERDPGDKDSWVALARLAEATSRYREALDAWGRALERDPDDAEVLLPAGRLALKAGDEATARAYFDQLLALSRDPEPVVKVAFTWLAARRPAQAAEVLDQARRTIDEPRLHFYAGLVRERLRAFALAADAFAQVKGGPGDITFEARSHRAACLSALGQHQAALDLYQAVAAERPTVPGVLTGWARALERAGRSAQAEGVLGRAMAEAPGAETWDAVVAFHARRGRPQAAVAALQKVAKARLDDEALQFALAAALERQGEWRPAVELMRRILAQSPGNAPAMNFIGYTLADHGGDLEEAERQVKRALEVRPDSPAYLDSLGWVYFHKGEADRAVEPLQRAVSAAPDEATLQEHLGDVLGRLRRTEPAREAYARALDLLAQDPDAGEHPGQRAEIERKLKSLTGKAAGR